MHRPDRLVLHGSAASTGREGSSPRREWSDRMSLSKQQQQQQQRKRVSDSQRTHSGFNPTKAMNMMITPSSLHYSCGGGGGAVAPEGINLTPSPPIASPPMSLLQSSTDSSSPQPLQQYAEAGGGRLPPMEGPLPAEVREIIYSHCKGDNAEVAERHARRLLSTSRRIRVYREELQNAVEEVGDIAQLVQRHEVVQEALCGEMQELDAKLEQLVRERELCKMQLDQEEELRQRKEVKLQEAKQRVCVLRSTIDAIMKESLTGQLLLRQLVPNLNVENYIA